MNRLMTVVALLALTLVAAGCTDGRTPSPQTTVRVLHAAPGHDELLFRRVESVAATLPYRGGAALSFEEDRYTFNVDVTPLDGSAPRRLLTFSEQVLSGTEYTFAILEVGGQLQQLVLEAPAFPSGTAEPRAMVLHAAAALPAVDLFVEPAGTDLGNAQPWGRVGFTESLPPRALPAGEYEATLTAPDDKQNVLFSSIAFEVSAGESMLFTVVDLTGEFSPPFGIVKLTNTSVQALAARIEQSAVRAINAAADGAPRDVVIDGDSDPPLLAALPYGVISEYAALARGNRELTITPAGNPGVLELEATVAAVGGRTHTLLFGGQPGELEQFFVLDDRRSVLDRAKVRFYNGANPFEFLDFYAVLPDVDVTAVVPQATLPGPGVSTTVALPPGPVEFLVRRTDTDEVVADPLSATMEAGGVYGVLALDDDGEPSTQLVLIDELD